MIFANERDECLLVPSCQGSLQYSVGDVFLSIKEGWHLVITHYLARPPRERAHLGPIQECSTFATTVLLAIPKPLRHIEESLILQLLF